MRPDNWWIAAAAVVMSLSTMAGPVVFPFQNRGDTAYDWLSYGLAFMIEDASPESDWLARLEAMEGMDLPETTTLTLATQMSVAEQMGEDELVTGWFEVRGDHLVATVNRYFLESGRMSFRDWTVRLSDFPAGVRRLDPVAGPQQACTSNMETAVFRQYVKAVLQARFSSQLKPLVSLADQMPDCDALQRRAGRLAYAQGESDVSWRCLRRLAHPTQQDLLLCGLSGVQSGHPGAALNCFLQGLREGKRPVFLLNAAGCLMMTGNIEEAWTLLSDIPVDAPDVLFNRAVVLAVRGDWVRASGVLTDLVPYMHQRPDYLKLLRTCCRRVPDAAPCSIAVLETTSASPDRKAEAEYSDLKHAYRFVEKLSGEEPVDLAPLKDAYLNLARRHLSLGEREKARQALGKLLLIDPLNLPGLCLMCEAFNDDASCSLLSRLNGDCRSD